MKKLHQFVRTVFSDGAPKFEAGNKYEPTDETTRHVTLGDAVEVEPEQQEKTGRSRRGE